MNALTEPWQYEFMWHAFAATAIGCAVCALLSCWLVLTGWSLMGDAVSHAILPGVALAAILGIPFVVGALVAAALAVLLIGTVRDQTGLREDAAIGTVFTALFALGLVIISVRPSQVDLHAIVFGNVLGVGGSDLARIAALGAIVSAVLLVKRRDLTLVAFDPLHAHAIGLSPRRLNALLLAALALTCVVALQVVGVVLVVAMLVVPGATALQLTQRFSRMLLLAPLLSVTAGVLGIYLGFHSNSSPGGCVVLVQAGFFVLAASIARLRRVLGARQAHRVRA